MKKFLVRELILTEGGIEKRFSLHYLELGGADLRIFPFDKEREGYAYCSALSLKYIDGGWIINSLRY